MLVEKKWAKWTTLMVKKKKQKRKERREKTQKKRQEIRLKHCRLNQKWQFGTMNDTSYKRKYLTFIR